MFCANTLCSSWNAAPDVDSLGWPTAISATRVGTSAVCVWSCRITVIASFVCVDGRSFVSFSRSRNACVVTSWNFYSYWSEGAHTSIAAKSKICDVDAKSASSSGVGALPTPDY